MSYRSGQYTLVPCNNSKDVAYIFRIWLNAYFSIFWKRDVFFSESCKNFEFLKWFWSDLDKTAQTVLKRRKCKMKEWVIALHIMQPLWNSVWFQGMCCGKVYSPCYKQFLAVSKSLMSPGLWNICVINMGLGKHAVGVDVNNDNNSIFFLWVTDADQHLVNTPTAWCETAFATAVQLQDTQHFWPPHDRAILVTLLVMLPFPLWTLCNQEIDSLRKRKF